MFENWQYYLSIAWETMWLVFALQFIYFTTFAYFWVLYDMTREKFNKLDQRIHTALVVVLYLTLYPMCMFEGRVCNDGIFASWFIGNFLCLCFVLFG